MGVGPWNIENTTRSPEGTKGTWAFDSPFRPFEAPPLFVLPNPWARAQWLHRFGPSGLEVLQATMLGCDCRLLGHERDGHGFFNKGRPKYFETRDAMIAFLSKPNYCIPVYRPLGLSPVN